jgi:class 3 adenylate cyclase
MGVDTAYDQCNTTEEIQQCLQALTKDLLAAIPAQARQPAHPLPAETQIALDILPTLTYSDLKHHPHPVFTLSELCRLLFKLGDQTALRQGLALSHTLYTFTCKRQESWHLSHLYKGIAQIGLHFTDLGIKNVLRGVAEHLHFTIMPVDQALGYWALTSAAILNRNLKLAASFAQRWYETAQAGDLAYELVRARLGCQLVSLLLDHESGRPKAEADWQALPLEWQPTGTFLLAWAAGLSEPDAAADPCAQRPPADPYPLFLGVAWYGSAQLRSAPASADESTPATTWFADDFRTLCELRRTFCHPAAAASLTTAELERYATCLARWELPRPLYDFETLLKHKAVEHNLRYVMTRLLGKQVMERFISQPPAEPQILTQDEAIILVMDVRQYSTLSEQRMPGEMFDLLNPLFKIITEEFERAGGAILEFIGDCIIIVFNTFQGQHSELSQILAHTVRCLQRIRVLNAMSLPAGLPEITLGVGINKGPVALGYLGGLERCHLTALGNTINLASRMESATKEFPADALLSARCFAKGRPNPWEKPLLTNYVLRELGQHTMRNITRSVHLFGVKPLLRYWTDFVPMGFVARAEPGGCTLIPAMRLSRVLLIIIAARSTRTARANC